MIDLSNKYDFIYFIGDSFTFAINQADDVKREVNKSNRFSSLVSSHFNLIEVNEGNPGCANHYIFRKVYQDIHKFVDEGKKFLVVLAYTYPERMEMFNNKVHIPVPINKGFSFYKDYIIESMNQDYCDQISTELIWAIHTLLDSFGIDYVESYMHSILKIPYAKNERVIPLPLESILDPVEDRFTPNGHANIKGNAKIASHYINKISELYGTN